MLAADLLRVQNRVIRVEPRHWLVIGHSWRSGQLKALAQSLIYRPFLAFFGAAFFEGVGFFVADLAPPRLPPNAVSQPSEYFLFGPTRKIVTGIVPAQASIEL
jgi:hypothetical protein